MDEGGKVIASGAEEHEAFQSPKPGWAEQDPRDWWRACRTSRPKAPTVTDLSAEDIACVGLGTDARGPSCWMRKMKSCAAPSSGATSAAGKSKKLEELFGLLKP